MVLQTQELSVGSSSLYPVSGMTYICSEDALILCLFDGSFHVIYGLSVDPSYFPPNPLSELTSEKLSFTSRSIFAKTSFGDIRRRDANRVSGMMSYDASSTVMWAHEYVVSLGMFSISISVDHT
jgi:general transcription factor 3C protein 4